MEYLTMFISHCVKTAEYFAIEGFGFSELSNYSLAEIAQAWFWQFAKIVEIYISIL